MPKTSLLVINTLNFAVRFFLYHFSTRASKLFWPP